MRTVALLACVVLVALSPAVAAVPDTGGPPQAPAADAAGDGPFASSPVDADRVVLTADVAENGDAQWSVAYRVELTTDNETAAFESLAADIAANRSGYTASFRDRMERTVGAAENATGREMTVENVSVSTSTESLQGYGVVTYSFRWTNFAAVEGDRISAGDSLSGFFLETDSRLVIQWPADYEATTVSPDPDDRSDRRVAWNGPVEFGSDGPTVVADPSGLPLSVLAGGLLLAVGLVAAGVYVYRRREQETPTTAATGTETPPGDDADDAGDTPAADQPDAADGPSEGTSDPGDGDAAPAAVDDELLSNEERVLRLLDAEGGRVKQQTVAKRLEWTDAKTSQVVGDLREDGQIEVFRLGRENVIVDPEESEL